jgi:hypothetical protein
MYWITLFVNFAALPLLPDLPTVTFYFFDAANFGPNGEQLYCLASAKHHKGSSLAL